MGLYAMNLKTAWVFTPWTSAWVFNRWIYEQQGSLCYECKNSMGLYAMNARTALLFTWWIQTQHESFYAAVHLRTAWVFTWWTSAWVFNRWIYEQHGSLCKNSTDLYAVILRTAWVFMQEQHWSLHGDFKNSMGLYARTALIFTRWF